MTLLTCDCTDFVSYHWRFFFLYSYWLFSGDKRKLVCIVNDLIEELQDLDVEPKLESLWWTSTYKNVATLKVVRRGQNWDLPFMEVFDGLGRPLFKRWERGARSGEDAKERIGKLLA